MARQQPANVFIRNDTDGTAVLQLYYRNSANETTSGSWVAKPGEIVGPLEVPSDVGTENQDHWWLRMSVVDGSRPGIYNTTGSAGAYGWKEHRLDQPEIADRHTFVVDSGTLRFSLAPDSSSNNLHEVGPFQKATHVFVLMLENHSFDNIFAKSGIPDIKVPGAGAKNTYKSVDYPVQSGAPQRMATDPGHEFLDVVEQLSGTGAVFTPGAPYPHVNNSGFAANYATSNSEQTGLPSAAQIGEIMKCFDTPNQLATEFVVCDQWFSSIPGPTWPNRYFVHGASSAGLDRSPSTLEITKWETVAGFVFPNGSIFDALNKAHLKWRIYRDRSGPAAGGIPQVSSIKGIQLTKINSFARFRTDLQGPYPYHYTFIEPNYGDVIRDTYRGGSSQHPMDGMTAGEALIKSTYEAIRNSPLWYSSLLIITYDEHGGFYDSEAPGSATPPGDNSFGQLNQYGFTFAQYGVRVRAVVISPYTVKGTVDHTVYDHASVAATLERTFEFPPLTARDAAAKDVLGLLSLTSPRTDCPTKLNNPAPAMMLEEVSTVQKTAAVALEPIPARGNLPGFLGVALKTEIELSSGTPAEKAVIMANFETIKTRAQAEAYIEKVMAKVDARQEIQQNAR